MNIQRSDNRLSATLNVLCPMHVLIGTNGRILHTGPTIQKLRPHRDLKGAAFLDVFTLERPRNLKSVEDILSATGSKIHVKLQDSPETALQGVIVAEPMGNGIIINLSFGISILEAVQDYALTSCDFAATDLAIELLFLVEAKSAAMDASQKLNTRLQNAKTEAEEQAFTDVLTGLHNRRCVELVLEDLIANRAAFSFLQLDLDFFKAVNDTFGHAAGDYVLQVVAGVLKDETRDQDKVARIGGDEFVVLVEGSVPKTRLAHMSSRVLARLKNPIMFEGNPCKISTSIGIASVRNGQETTADLIMQQADRALYSSKENGRSRYSFYSEC